MVGAEPQDEQGLRKAVRSERSVHPRGDDTSDGEASGAQMRLLTVSEEAFSATGLPVSEPRKLTLRIRCLITGCVQSQKTL